MVIAKITNSTYYIILGILLICLYIYPYIILGQDSMLRIHDTLDSVMPNMVAVAHSRQAFKLDGVINNIMNGLPRSSFVSPFYVVQWLFIFFHPFTAFVINAFIVHLIAFIGMFLLLKNHFLQSEENTFIAFGCALCFAIIPHMQLFGLSVAGTPLLLYAFLNLFNKKKYFVSYSIILFFPFYSSVVLSGIFIICGVMLLFAVDCFINKHLNKQVLIGMLILVAGYALTEYRLISDIFLNSAFVTHRVEWNVYKASYGFKAAVTTALSNFIYEDKHAYNLHTLILVFSTIASISISLKNNFSREYKTKLLIPILITLSTWLFLWFFILNGVMPATAITEIDTALQTFPILSPVAIFIHKYLFFILVLCSVLLISTKIVTLIPSKSKIFLEKNSKLLFILVLIAFIISLFYGFYRWDSLIPLIKEKIPFLVTFKMDRFYFLHPIVWYLIFALSLSIIHKLKYGKYFVLFLIVCQINYLFLSPVAIFIHKYLFFILVLCSVLLISTIIVTLIPSKSKIFLEKNSKLLFILVLIAFIISLFYGFYRWDGLIPLKEKIPFLVTFQMNRFYFLHPIVWYLIFALSLSIIRKLKYGKYLVLFLVVCQIYYLYINNNDYNNQLQYNIKAVYCKIKGINLDSSYLTYRKFFSENLYKEIKEYIAVPQEEYRVVSIGLYPSIASYNGFYTLDGYINNYPLEYKHKFRKIIEKELSKSKRWREYFDYWGSRCYVFVSEFDNREFENQKDNTDKIHNLSLNTEQLKTMGGKYIFSAWEIMNAEENKLDLLNVFERNDSPWRIYLYKVK